MNVRIAPWAIYRPLSTQLNSVTLSLSLVHKQGQVTGFTTITSQAIEKVGKRLLG